MKTLAITTVPFLLRVPAFAADYKDYEMGSCSWRYSKDETTCDKARRDHVRATDYREIVRTEGAVRYAEG
jgi:hypothetical protein